MRLSQKPLSLIPSQYYNQSLSKIHNLYFYKGFGREKMATSILVEHDSLDENRRKIAQRPLYLHVYRKQI